MIFRACHSADIITDQQKSAVFRHIILALQRAIVHYISARNKHSKNRKDCKTRFTNQPEKDKSKIRHQKNGKSQRHYRLLRHNRRRNPSTGTTCPEKQNGQYICSQEQTNQQFFYVLHDGNHLSAAGIKKFSFFFFTETAVTVLLHFFQNSVYLGTPFIFPPVVVHFVSVLTPHPDMHPWLASSP